MTDKPIWDQLAEMGRAAMSDDLPEPYGQITTHTIHDQQFFYRWPESPYLDNAKECVNIYTTDQMRAAVAKERERLLSVAKSRADHESAWAETWHSAFERHQAAHKAMRNLIDAVWPADSIQNKTKSVV